MTLACPLCGAGVARDATDLRPGRCPSCGARFDGGGDDARGTIAAVVADLAPGVDADRVAAALFALAPGEGLGSRAAVTSDRRPGFYRWWVFLREGPEDAGALLRRLATEA